MYAFNFVSMAGSASASLSPRAAVRLVAGASLGAWGHC